MSSKTPTRSDNMSSLNSSAIKSASHIEEVKEQSITSKEQITALKDQPIAPKETIQELLSRLEKNLLAKTKAIEELKEKIYTAQEEKYKALLELSSVKEQYLLNVVTALQKEK
jgi:hypothetical protein